MQCNLLWLIHHFQPLLDAVHGGEVIILNDLVVGVGNPINASFSYDGDGNRIMGIIDGTTTTYIGNYFEWTGSTSTMNVKSRYYYAGSTHVAMRTGSSTINYLQGDHLGSNSITTSSSGVKSAEIRYYPWGTTRYTSGSTPTTYRFTGQRIESSIGLYFYGARISGTKIRMIMGGL